MNATRTPADMIRNERELFDAINHWITRHPRAWAWIVRVTR